MLLYVFPMSCSPINEVLSTSSQSTSVQDFLRTNLRAFGKKYRVGIVPFTCPFIQHNLPFSFFFFPVNQQGISLVSCFYTICGLVCAFISLFDASGLCADSCYSKSPIWKPLTSSEPQVGSSWRHRVKNFSSGRKSWNMILALFMSTPSFV